MSLIESLESRVLLAADWSAFSPEQPFGPEYRPSTGVDVVAWRGGSIEMKESSWILSFDEKLGGEDLERVVRAAGTAAGAEVQGFEALAGGRYAVVEFDRLPSGGVIEALPGLVDGVKGVDPNAIYRTNRLPNDPLFPQQQWLDNTGQFVADQFGWFVGNGVIGADISAPEAWDITIGSRDVLVGVIDTGVDMDHPDLVANIWRNPGEIPDNGLDDDGNGFVDDVNGWDFGEGDNNPDDVDGHGTGSAGMIGAVGNNGIGVSGTAWDVSIVPMKIADRFGNLLLSAIISAHDYLTMMREDLGHNIVASNNSYGAFAPAFYEDEVDGFVAEKEAIQRFIDSGATFVASAGNDFNDNDTTFTAFPASYDLPGLISVAATNPDDTLALYSNYGAETVDLAAPGVGVLTTGIGGVYQHFGGTSAAGPVVVGAVALLKTHRPGASAVEVRQALIDGADQLPALQGRVVSGGRLNMYRSLLIIGTDGPVVTGFDPGPITSRTDPDTGLPIDTITVTFNKDIDASTLDASAAQLTYAGADGEFGTGDDNTGLVPVLDVEVRAGDASIVDITLDLTGVPQQRLPLGHYRLTLFPGTPGDPKFQDVDGNLLNGDSSGGDEEEYDFEVVGVGGNLEPNDTLAGATPVAFNGSGDASYRSITLGDGLKAGLDVDLYEITLPRGGLITAEITAQRLALPSELDAYLRLFDAEGNELASNDQFFGRDSFLDFFVTTGGTYYIGISGFPNTDYDPEISGSGQTQSTGVYDLEIGYQRIADDRLVVASDLESPLPVPAEGTQGTQSTTLTVTDGRAIKDLNLRLDLDHNFVSDLEITLIAPDGTEQVVFDQHGAGGDDFENVLLDDEAATPIADATPPYTGSLSPTNGLNRFDGKSALGTWTLLIRDRRALNSGQLNSWALEFTLENDIFGPFESNDTPATARTLSEINGTGSSTVEAEIGDGGFGTLDRDLYRITVDAGTTLNATVTSIGASEDDEPTLNTALRLFDADGNEIKASSPAGTFNASISSFVFPAGGVYYVAVSEGGNVAYDPFDVTSGEPLTTTGHYRLAITVSPGISDPATVLEGERIDLGVDSDGTFGASDEFDRPIGLRFENTDFLLDSDTGADLTSMYGLTASGYDFMNDGSRGPTALPVSLTNQSGPFNNRVTAVGLFRGLKVERTVTYGDADGFVAFDVVLTNSSGAPLTDVAWLEALDPNQGLNLDDRGPDTENDVDSSGRYALASVSTNAYREGLSIALAAPASDSRALATFLDADAIVLRDPSQVLALGTNDPNGASDDLLMALAYDLGTIAAGESVSMRYFVFMGQSPAAAQAMYDELNAGTGDGHLTVDPATPATEELSNGETAPTLANRYYYPAGFSSPFIYSFVPMINPHDEPTRVVVIARYEVGGRDDVIADFTIDAQARGGITVNTPDMYNIGFGNPGGSLVRPDEPYALEIRAERPIAATFSYFDTFLLAGERAAVGESFTASTSDTWTFGSVGKAPGRFDFPVYMNTTGETIKVVTTLLPTGGGEEIVLTQELGAYRRGGWNLSALDSVPEGTYGMVIEAQGAIVASHQSYDSGLGSGEASALGTVGLPNLGSITGATPEGEIGINSSQEIVGVTNANESAARVTFSFLFEGGSAYRTLLEVPARARGELDVSELPGFPAGQPYSIAFESNVPVAMSLPTLIFSDGAGTMFTDQAYTLWAFGAGFRPQNGHEEAVTEYLRLFNPSDSQVVVEITIRFDGDFAGTDEPLGQETFRRVLEPGRVSEFDVHSFVTGARREQDVFYGLTVKAADPIVAYLGRYDAFFPGAFGTLGVPLGLTGPI